MKNKIAAGGVLLMLAIADVRAEIVTILSQSPVHSYPQATSSAYTNTYRNGVTTGPSYNTNWIVTIRAGEVCRVIGVSDTPGFVYQFGSETNSWHYASTSGSTQHPFTLVGPASVSCNGTSYGGFVTLSITRAEDFVTPSNLLAVAPDAAGPVSVQMESSTNLAVWMPAYPGTYGVATQMRYFRLRATRTILDAPAGQ